MSVLPGRAPTLESVAETAGVSRATASRVVNGSSRVSPLAREAVERAIRELGYVPNRAARSLVTRRSESVALVLSEPETQVFTDPFFATVVRSAGAALADRGQQLVLVLARSDPERERVVHYAQRGHVDGALVISLHGADPLPHSLRETGLPVVLLGRPDPTAAGLPYVDADNVGGARTATAHLLEQGRTVVATVAGPADMSVGQDRLAGYRAALRGRRAGRGLVEHADFTADGGEAAMERLLARRADIDGVFVASDLMAMGALRALRAAGRRVPDDVAVVGFDDSPVAAASDPGLTTMHQPVDEMVQEMVDLLLGDDGEGPPDDTAVVLATSLVARDSA